MDGLYLSILSITRRTKEPIQFYVMSADFTLVNANFQKFSQKNEAIIKNMVKRYNQDSDFNVIDCTNLYNELLANSKNKKTKYSPYASFRLLLDKITQLNGKIIYLDSDTMAYGDIKELYDIDLQDAEFAVSHDRLGRYWIRKDYFNSGVMLFNIDKIRETKLFEKARVLYLNQKYMFPDQTALYKSVTKYIFFPNEYRFNNQSTHIQPDTIIKHFCGRVLGWPLWYNIKQWDIKNVHRHLKIHEFDEDFDIYLKDKDKW